MNMNLIFFFFFFCFFSSSLAELDRQHLDFVAQMKRAREFVSFLTDLVLCDRGLFAPFAGFSFLLG